MEIRRVTTKKEQREFVKFPLELYKGNDYFVPALYSGEFAIFKNDYPFNKVCDTVCFSAYENGKVIGRIQGIIQREANEKWGQKRVRFTRFDCIDDVAVASALFSSVEAWAKEKGMEEFVGPLGYSDLEREGLLIEGFDQEQTYEEQYNYPYYQSLLERCGFEKEIDWIECQLRAPAENGDRIIQFSERMLKRFELRLVVAGSIREIVDDHIDSVFNIIEKAYSRLYGTMPLNKEIIDNYIKDFKLIVRPHDLLMIYDKNDRMVGFSLLFPSISEAARVSDGHITPAFLIKFLKAKKHPRVIDLGLIGILPEYESKGVASIMIGLLINMLKTGDLDHVETNLMLENNYNIQNLIKYFDKRQNKRRRCFIKKIQ